MTYPDDIMKAAREAIARNAHIGLVESDQMIFALARVISEERQRARNEALEEAATILREEYTFSTVGLRHSPTARFTDLVQVENYRNQLLHRVQALKGGE